MKVSTKSALVTLGLCLALVTGVSYAVDGLHWTTWARVWDSVRWMGAVFVFLRALGLEVPSPEGRGPVTAALVVQAGLLRWPPAMLVVAATEYYGRVGTLGWCGAMWAANLAFDAREALIRRGGQWSR